jgi:hypothetical protein
MPDQNPIYDFMKSNKLTDLDEKTFINKYSAPDKAKEIYSFMASNKLTDLDETKFYDKYLKKKVGGEESSLTELSSKGFSPEQISLLQTGTKPPKPVGKTGGTTIIPTNITPDQKAYERELKRQDAAINTLKNTYSKKGLNFNEKSKRGQEQIAELLDKEINNDLTLVTGKDQKPYLVRGEGFLESAGRGILRSIIDPIESTKINFTNDAVELADLLDEKIKEEPNVPESAPTRVGGYLGELAGGLPKMMALLAIPVAGESAMVGEMYHNALANQRRVLYERGLQEGMDRTTAAQNAMKNAPITAIPDAIVGAALARGVGGKAAGTEIIPNAAKESFLKATGNGLKGVAKVSGIGGAAEFGRSKAEQQLGYNVTDAEAIENGLRGMGEYAIMDAAFKLAHSGPKYLSSAAKNLLSSVPKEVLEVAAEKYPDGKQTLEDVAKFTETKAKVQDFVPEEKVAAVAGLTEKTDNLKLDIEALEEKKKALPPAIASKVDVEIADKNKEIKFYDNQIKKVVESKDITGIKEEIDDLTGLKAGEIPVEEYDLKNGDIITANIYGKQEKGKVIGVGTKRGEIVIDFIDENNNQRFVYADQVQNIERGQAEIDNLSSSQKARLNELLNKEELTQEDLAEISQLNKAKTEVKQIEDITQFPETLKAKKKPEVVEEVKPLDIEFRINEKTNLPSEGQQAILINGKPEGDYQLLTKNGKTFLNDVVIYNKELRGKGYGIDTYKNIIDKLNENNTKLYSTNYEETGTAISPQALSVWEKLEKEGYAKKIGEIDGRIKDRVTGIDEMKKTPIYESLNPKEYAIQEPSPEGVLQPKQERVRETGGERKRVEPSVKGKEIAKEGKQVEGDEKVVAKKTYQEALKEKQEAEKKQTRQVAGEKSAVTKEIYRKVNETLRPLASGKEGAQEIALRYLADGGKVSKAAVDEAYGSTKRAELNVKRRELLSQEVKSKDFVQGNEKLDDLAHRLWQDNKQKVSERDIKDKLMAEIGNNNTRLEAAEAYLDQYNAEYKLEKQEMRLAEQYKEEYLEEQAKLEEELRKPLDEQIEGEASEEHINNLIKQYEAEIKGEDQQIRPESEGEVSSETGKGEAVKEASKAEERLAQEYKEVVKKASKKAKENAKKDFVDRNFDSIVAKLKIQIKCPT